MNEINHFLFRVFAEQGGGVFLAMHGLLGTVLGKLVLFGPLGCAAIGLVATLFLSGYDAADGDDD